MEQRKMALVSLMGCAAGTTPLYPPFKGEQGAHLAVAPTSASGMPHATDAEDAVHLRLLEEKGKNRWLSGELKHTKSVVKALVLRRELEKKVFVEAVRVLGWSAIAATCVACTVSTVRVAPLWTAIAPAVLAGLAMRKARDAM